MKKATHAAKCASHASECIKCGKAFKPVSATGAKYTTVGYWCRDCQKITWIKAKEVLGAKG